MKLNWAEEQWQTVVTQCMTEVERRIDLDLKQVSQNTKRQYMQSMCVLMIESLRKSEMWDHLVCDFHAVLKRTVESQRTWYENATETAKQKQAHFEECQAAWALQDDVCKRLQMLEPIIDKMLPLDGDNTRSYTNQQAIRSRGMVLAAMFGLQSIGGPSLAEPAETHAKKPAKATNDYTYRGFAPEPKDTPPINMDGLGL